LKQQEQTPEETESIKVCGMSVPPLMMAQVSNQVWLQWLSKIEGKK
jgi:hypothetical protein